MVLKISRSRKRKKSTLWLWLFLLFLLLIIIAVVLYFILAGKKTPSGPSGPFGPIPSGPTPPPGPTPKDDSTDCLALNFYGGDTGGAAPQKICGVFDGFSHWSWAGMQQWLAYFRYKTGAKRVIIYEAQFVPESWMNEVGATITNHVKGKKRSANLLPMTCKPSDNVCKGDVKTGTDKAPGLNWKCENDICVDQCLVAPSPQCTAPGPGPGGGQCVKHYKSLNCPHSGYCRKDNNSCHYDTPHSGDGPSMKSCTTNANCKCPGGDYCHNKSTCHLTHSNGTCQKTPPPTPGCGGTCPASICPFTDLNKGKATCGDNCFCKQCYISKDNPIAPQCKPKEEYTEGRPLWSAWKDGGPAPKENSKTAGFSTYYTSVGSLWDGKNLKGVKGDKGAALCPYGSFYDPLKGDYGQCVEHLATCPSPGETSMMGFCDNSKRIKHNQLPRKSISVYVGKNLNQNVPANYDSNTGYAMLPIPEITLTWYALVGAAQHKGNVAIDYITTVLDFCQKAGISRLAFPFIVPDNQNYAPYMIANADDTIPPAEGYGKAQVTNAMKWLVTNLLTPAKTKGIEIGLNVYASSKDARWQQWWRGGGVPTCHTDPCPPDNKKDCDAITSCTWQKNGTNKCGCFPVQNPPNLCVESFTTGGSMKPDPCSAETVYTQCKTGSCSWPYIATFIKLLNAQAKANAANIQQVTFLQVDQEWCHCGVLADNVAIAHNIIPSVEFTIATSLGTPGSPAPHTSGSPAPHTSVPEVYWDAGNQFPCTGGPGTYEYLTPPCTSWSSHRKLKNQPKAFYDLMVGDSNHGGSDDSDEGKQNAWLGRGKFNTTVTSLKNEGYLTVTPSFSIENLSMCSEPNEMQLTGDTKKGTARWQCLPKPKK